MLNNTCSVTTNSDNMYMQGGDAYMNHIKQLRKNAGIKTSKEAAKFLNISDNMMYQMERGVKRPSPKLAIAISKVFNCTLEDIFLPYYIANLDN